MFKPEQLRLLPSPPSLKADQPTTKQKPTNQPTHPPNQPTHPPTNQPTHPTNQPTHPPTNPPTHPPTNPPTKAVLGDDAHVAPPPGHIEALQVPTPHQDGAPLIHRNREALTVRPYCGWLRNPLLAPLRNHTKPESWLVLTLGAHHKPGFLWWCRISAIHSRCPGKYPPVSSIGGADTHPKAAPVGQNEERKEMYTAIGVLLGEIDGFPSYLIAPPEKPGIALYFLLPNQPKRTPKIPTRAQRGSRHGRSDDR